ncbi:MAG TPA: carbohydrate-binding family 9-like protein [Thermoanaerobaculia bacterium]|nr:carbohydrate-binding family 9-like protein [Thermoanaerobaculia bacterium]
MSDPLPVESTVQRLSSELWGSELFSDGVWSLVEPLSALVRVEDGGAASWPTIVRLAWSSEGLAVRFDCEDQNRWASLSRRDDPLWLEEVVEVFLQFAEKTGGVYFEFEVNPIGALFDAVIRNPSGDRRKEPLEVGHSWNCRGLLWGVGKTGRSEDWWAVLAMPWRSLALGAAPRWCRANFYRVERPQGRNDEHAEQSAWSPTLRAPADFHVPSRFGTLRFSS